MSILILSRIFVLVIITNISECFDVNEWGMTGYEEKIYQYGIMIDAGSSHTEATLYQWPQDEKCSGSIERVDSCETKPGISDYAKEDDDTKKAAQDILKCINQVMSKINLQPDTRVQVYLAATAGMRVALIENPRSVKVLDEIRRSLRNIPHLQVKKIDVMKGQYEGLFAWVTNNMALGTLQSQRKLSSTVGMLDMGGASSQIAFRTGIRGMSGRNEMRVNLFRRTHSVHAFSNLCFGMDQGRARYYHYLIFNSKVPTELVDEIESPCFPKGTKIVEEGESLRANPCLKMKSGQVNYEKQYTFVGTGDAEKCAQIVDQQILNQDQCERTFIMCQQTMSRPPPSYKTFVATSGFFENVNVLELTENTSDQFKEKMTQVCNSERADILTKFKRVNERYVDRLCFQLNFIYSTLKNVYKFTDELWPNIQFAKELEGTELGWSLGLIAYEVTADCDLMKFRPGVGFPFNKSLMDKSVIYA